MKKIYSKMTKNRQRSFQIETYITQNKDGEKKVYKRALTEEAKGHVNRIYGRYLSYQNKDIVCEAESVDDGIVVFPFINGRSLNSEILQCMEKQDRNAFEDKLKVYRDMVDAGGSFCEKPQTENEESIRIFGAGQWPYECKYATGLNIDMCFDNIIHLEDRYVIIDYEWVFDFPLPVNFVIYRAIWALHVRYNEEMRGMYSWEELCDFFGISEREVLQYERMNRCFTDYVYGGTEGYYGILSQYTKKVYSMQEIQSKTEEPENYVQIFADMGQGYSEENSKKDAIVANKVVSLIDVSEYCEAEEFRVDPSVWPFICKELKIEVEDKFGNQYAVEEPDCAGCMKNMDLLMFAGNDPQIKFTNMWKKRIKFIKVSFEVLKCLTDQEKGIFDAIRQQEEWYRKDRERLLVIKHELEKQLNKAVGEIMLREFESR